MLGRRPCEHTIWEAVLSPTATPAIALSGSTSSVAGAKPRLLLTTCSAGKRCRTALSAAELPRSPQPAVAAAWLSRLDAEAGLVPADELYSGQAFTLARQAAKTLHADFGVLSAGLGYVRGGTPIPAYDLTVGPRGPGSVMTRVTGEFDPAEWWRTATGGRFSENLEQDMQGRELVLACLSRSYAAMVSAGLCRFVATGSGALRIFGLSIEAALPAELRPFVIPYDARLDAVTAPGTRVTFPQRALAHFAVHVLPFAATIADQRSMVLACLASAEHPPARRQNRAGDAAIKRLIANAIARVGKRSSAVLSHIRHVEGVSCEQRRFSDLFKAVSAEGAT